MKHRYTHFTLDSAVFGKQRICKPFDCVYENTLFTTDPDKVTCIECLTGMKRLREIIVKLKRNPSYKGTEKLKQLISND